MNENDNNHEGESTIDHDLPSQEEDDIEEYNIEERDLGISQSTMFNDDINDPDLVRACTREDHLDIIDMNRIDNTMCGYIWNDFKQQYKPFVNSLFKLTNVDSQYYFSIPENREIVYNYINVRLRGVKLLKFRPIGMSYIFFTLKRVNSEMINKVHVFEKRLIEFKDRLDIIQEQVTKIYNAPGMPGYIEALDNFNDTMNKININN
jgi:hypothetical protein